MSHVITFPSGKVGETFDAATVEQAKRAGLRVETISQYLGRKNDEIKEAERAEAVRREKPNKQWFRIDHNTKAVTATKVGHLRAACEVQLRLTKKGAYDLVSDAEQRDGVIILGTARFEFR